VTQFVGSKKDIVFTVASPFARDAVRVPAGQQLFIQFGGLDGYARQPKLLFGDSARASYVETDAVDFEGQPIPEMPLPAIMMLISATIVITATKHIRRRAFSSSGCSSESS
jgi:hypothetical protein